MASEIKAEPLFRIPIVDRMNGLVKRIAVATAWLNVILIAVILLQVVMRYGFNRGMVPLEELMWHLYAVAFMFGMAYAIAENTHIRVDIIYLNISVRRQHAMEIFGILVLLLPFLWVLFHHSVSWTYDAWRVGEASANPTGLPYRWVIKAVVPLSAVLMFIAAIARLIRASLLWINGNQPRPASTSDSALKKLFRITLDEQPETDHEASSHVS